MVNSLVPTFTFGPTGFVAPDGPSVLAGVQGDINAAFGNTLNYDLRTPQGQLSMSWASVIDNTYAAFQFFAQQVDPAYATGRMQDAIGRIYGMQRQPSIPTQLQVSCVGGTGVVIPTGALIQDQNSNLYTCIAGGTIPATGSIVLQFNALIPGPISVPGFTAVAIYQAVPGWDSVTVVSGVAGQNTEGRSAFETRRQDSVAGNSLGAIGSILGAISNVANVTDFYGYNNNTAASVTPGTPPLGITVPAYSIYICVAGGLDTDIGNAILSKKGAGAPMMGNHTVTVYDSNPLYVTPIAYQITYQIAQPIQILWNVVLVSNPNIPADATTQVQNALIAAAAGTTNLDNPPPRCRIASTIYAQNYIPAITALGPWAQVSSITVGSNNTPSATFTGTISGNTLTVGTVFTGAIAPGQFLSEDGNRIINGTTIVSGSGSVWTVSNPQTLGTTTATGNTTGSSVNVTLSAVTGTVTVNDVISGTGIPAGTTIVSQTSGTTGGAGVYVMSAAANLSAVACTITPNIFGSNATASSIQVLATQVPQVTAANIIVGHT